MKDAVATMGAMLPDDAIGRDAVHVAVFSATAPQVVFPGQDVGIVQRTDGDALVSAKVEPLIGIVDPFIRSSIPVGARFWVYLYPRTITALAHRWSHPAFETTETAYATPNARAASEAWLRGFIAISDVPGYDEVMREAELIADGNGYGDSITFGVDASGEIPNEFWDHVAIVLGRQIKGPRARYFACSC